ncbi:MAG: hypothetical protein J6586_10600 [Snodgrassella sp.]|uniref:hypothetical protein n=1 Tax=Snodgrassella sp. TaxID=2815304 RepID=UPI002588CAFB|nr:hypothetical protein [Snodgrassella sp.]MCO6516920.1 hypothetical protein [Snodgrassella sp.]MCO6526034.1 hypothetical protein [Snodgrassella sp.]
MRANQLFANIDQFAQDLQRKYNFYPDLTVYVCACALGHISDMPMLIYSMNPQLAPAYLEGADYNAIVERIKKEKKEFDASIARDEEKINF